MLNNDCIVNTQMGGKAWKAKYQTMKKIQIIPCINKFSAVQRILHVSMLTNKWHTNTEQTEETREAKHLTHKLN